MKMFFVGAAAVLAAAAGANAQFTANNAGPINSAAAVGNVNNGSFTFNYAGPAFQVGTIRLTGNLTDGGQANNWANDARWRITNPTGQTFTLGGATATQVYTGTIAVGPTSFSVAAGAFSSAANSIGNWTFQAFEQFDEGGATGVDNVWTNLSFEFLAFVPPTPPTTIHNFGLLAQGPAQTSYSHSFAQTAGNTISWMRFDWNPAAGDQLVIDTLGSVIPTGTSGSFANDTEIGLYDSNGNLVLSNDDGSGFASGDGRSKIVRNPGQLAAGTYYVAVGTFNSAFAGAFGVTNTSTYTGTQGQGTIQVNITVPAPASMAMVGLGGLVAFRRRRA